MKNKKQKILLGLLIVVLIYLYTLNWGLIGTCLQLNFNDMQISYYLPKIKATQERERLLKEKMTKLENTRIELERLREDKSTIYTSATNAIEAKYITIESIN